MTGFMNSRPRKCKSCGSERLVCLEYPHVHGACGHYSGYDTVFKCLNCFNEYLYQSTCDANVDCFCVYRMFGNPSQDDLKSKERGNMRLLINCLTDPHYGLSDGGGDQDYDIGAKKMTPEQLLELQRLLKNVQAATLRKVDDVKKIVEFIRTHSKFLDTELAAIGVGKAAMYEILNKLASPTKGTALNVERKVFNGPLHYEHDNVSLLESMLSTMLGEAVSV